MIMSEERESESRRVIENEVITEVNP